MTAQTSKISISVVLMMTVFIAFKSHAQKFPKQSIAVLNIDSKGLSVNSQTITNMARLELEKTGIYTVLDRYEVNDIVTKNQIDLANCYSKSCLVTAGRLLKVDKMLGGNMELMGDKKIVVSLRIVDVASGEIEKSEATEYLKLPEMQKMLQISVQKIVGVVPNTTILNQLVDYDVPIQSPKNMMRLNGPRMGFALMTGDIQKIETAPLVNGGFNMFPVSFQFGWQQEFEYISAGNFQALVENIFMISGLESGRFIPNYAPLLGFRFGKHAWEFGFGPTFTFSRKAQGYFDGKGSWNIQSDSTPSNVSLVSRLDSRGSVYLNTGLVIAFGKTFRSGYLNIPLNVYIAPSRDGTQLGATFGFNIQKKDRRSNKQLIEKEVESQENEKYYRNKN